MRMDLPDRFEIGLKGRGRRETTTILWTSKEADKTILQTSKEADRSIWLI